MEQLYIEARSQASFVKGSHSPIADIMSGRFQELHHADGTQPLTESAGAITLVIDSLLGFGRLWDVYPAVIKSDRGSSILSTSVESHGGLHSPPPSPEMLIVKICCTSVLAGGSQAGKRCNKQGSEESYSYGDAERAIQNEARIFQSLNHCRPPIAPRYYGLFQSRQEGLETWIAVMAHGGERVADMTVDDE